MRLGNVTKSRTGAVALGSAVLVTLGGVGGATAANMITSHDIKDETIQARDIHRGGVTTSEVRNGTLRMRDLNPSTRNRIRMGNDQIPAGKTVTGAIGADFDNSAPGGTADWGTDASLPMAAPGDITDADVSVVVSEWQDGGSQLRPTTTDGNVNCTGTVAAPTAPPGKVCIYVTGADNAVNLSGYSVAFGTGGSKYGFKLKWDVDHPGDSFVDAVWAYTAP